MLVPPENMQLPDPRTQRIKYLVDGILCKSRIKKKTNETKKKKKKEKKRKQPQRYKSKKQICGNRLCEYNMSMRNLNSRPLFVPGTAVS